ncbi:MAG: recombinase family protein [Verrucomicrobiaceae bacterium]|nr:recombinase family protein [Verrucomicrobiaceae bacterium]
MLRWTLARRRGPPHTVQILAAVAEEEARAISSRTKAALASAKARGVILGKHGAKLGKANHEQAVKTAHNLKTTIEALKSEGITAVREVATALNARGIATPQGKQWHSTSVHRLLKRLDKAS